MKKKIGLIGFGKTGKAVANVILNSNDFKLEWVLRSRPLLENRSITEYLGVPASIKAGKIFSVANNNIQEFITNNPVDIIIDFSSRTGIFTYGKFAANAKIRIISAISHYKKEDIEYLKELSNQTIVFWSPNITLGVNYLLYVSKLLKKIAPEVDIAIIEEHFKGKEGISGTAIKIAEALKLDNNKINSVRAGGIVGKHEIVFGFPYQTVRLTHESIAREAFGNGALFIARNLPEINKGLLNFQDVLSPLFKEK